MFFPPLCQFILYVTAPSESLEINFKVSSALVEIVQQITTKPRYILAKVCLQFQMTKCSYFFYFIDM